MMTMNKMLISPNGSGKITDLIFLKTPSKSFNPTLVRAPSSIFLGKLSEHVLDHENAYVRSSTASAIAEAIDQMPQKASDVIHHLEELYLEKAKILAPEFDEFVRDSNVPLTRSPC